MNQKVNFLLFFILVSILIFSVGCYEQKAQAVKIAAEKFRIESISALENIRNLFRQSISMPVEDKDDEIKRLAKDLDAEQKIGAEELALLINDKEIGSETLILVNKEFEEIEKGYYQFEAMFHSLRKGSFLAKDKVKKAEKHAINLTVQMINFANFLEKHPVQFTGRRTLIIENIATAKLEENSSLRMKNLKIVAKDILQLINDEKKAKNQAILQCLKAAEAGKLVADLIRNYKSMSVDEFLVSIRNALNFITEISGGNQNLASLLKRYDSVVTTIREDPYWNVLLDEKIVQ